MAGLDPAIHVFVRGTVSVEDRVTPGHDGERERNRGVERVRAHPLAHRPPCRCMIGAASSPACQHGAARSDA
jgi:hypothetical protein